MIVVVRLMGALRGISGREKFSMRLRASSSVKELVRALTKKLPNLGRTLIDPELDDPRPNALILLNGREISALDGLKTMLKDGDEVVFVPVLHGG